MPNDRIAREWESFAAAVIPTDAGEVQRREMRIAFFGGATAMLNAMFELSQSNVNEEQGVTALELFRDEMQDFARRVRDGEL